MIGSRSPSLLRTPSRKATWLIFHPPSRWTSRHYREHTSWSFLLSRGGLSLQSTFLRVSQCVRLVIFRDARTRSRHCWTSYRHMDGKMHLLFGRNKGLSIPPKLRPFKKKYRNSAKLGSSTPSHTCQGFLILSLWTKRKVPSASIFISMTWTRLALRTISLPLIIDQVIDACASHEVLSFMDGLLGYNQIRIHQQDQYKIAFTTPWGTFTYCVMPFGLKNARATFQRTMSYVFHDLVHIILAYLDVLTARSKKR